MRALFLKLPNRARLRVFSTLALAACLTAGSAWAADKGPRHHAQGQYDTVTLTYVVVEGDDLVAVSERFEIPVDVLGAQNKLTSNDSSRARN